MTFFKDKTVIITGGASGIGRAIGKELASQGAILILADINESMLIETMADFTKSGHKIKSVHVDVSAFDNVKKMIDDTISELGRIDYLFNNAGIVIAGDARDCTYEDWRKVIDVNLYGALNGVIAVYPIMVKQGFGHIINTASAAGLIPVPGEISYTASKYGIVGLSNALRVEGAALGVKVSVICPGFIETPILYTSKINNFDRVKFLDLMPKAMSADKCAQVILNGVKRNKAIIIVTTFAKILWIIQRISPAFMRWFWGFGINQMRKIRIEN